MSLRVLQREFQQAERKIAHAVEPYFEQLESLQKDVERVTANHRLKIHAITVGDYPDIMTGKIRAIKHVGKRHSFYLWPYVRLSTHFGKLFFNELMYIERGLELVVDDDLASSGLTHTAHLSDMTQHYHLHKCMTKPLLDRILSHMPLPGRQERLRINYPLYLTRAEQL